MTLSQVRDAWLELLNAYTDRLLGDHGAGDARLFFSKDASDCLDFIRGMIKAETTDIPPNVTSKLIRFCFGIMEAGWTSAIERSFGSSMRDLAAIGKRSAKAVVEKDGMRVIIQNKKATIKIPTRPKLALAIEVGDVPYLKIRENGDVKRIMLGQERPKADSKPFAWHVMVHVFFYLSRMARSDIQKSHYLPASRSGIVAGYRLMTSDMIKRAASASAGGAMIPKLSGITSDFMHSLIDAPLARGPFCNIAESLERELCGEITRTTDPVTHFPEISYRHKRRVMPLHMTSSSVSEVAPLVLYLKHVVDKGDLLILEEPEAHLDFEMQRVLARHIVRMIRAGLNVLITTHSFFVQEQISQCLSDGRPPSSILKKLGRSEDEYLYPQEVSYHLFDKDDAHDSYVASREKISVDDGIPLKKFDESIENLHKDKVAVEYGR